MFEITDMYIYHGIHVYNFVFNVFFVLGVRDYIHVLDLADGHSAAIKKLEESPGLKVTTSRSDRDFSFSDTCFRTSS